MKGIVQFNPLLTKLLQGGLLGFGYDLATGLNEDPGRPGWCLVGVVVDIAARNLRFPRFFACQREGFMRPVFLHVDG